MHVCGDLKLSRTHSVLIICTFIKKYFVFLFSKIESKHLLLQNLFLTLSLQFINVGWSFKGLLELNLFSKFISNK